MVELRWRTRLALHSLGEWAFHKMFRFQAAKEHAKMAFTEVEACNASFLELIFHLRKEAYDLYKGVEELRQEASHHQFEARAAEEERHLE